VSLAWHLSLDARLDLAPLDPRIQEDVLDEVERLCDDPSLIPSASANLVKVHSLTRIYDRTLHFVPLQGVLYVLGVNENTGPDV
jgi:hypothetical protein